MTASRFRGSAVVWAMLLAYASLYPFFPLRAPAPDALAGFFLPPRYVIRSDIAFNVIAYVPLGTLACLYFRHRGLQAGAIWRAVAVGAAFSFAMEMAQLFIPNRVASIFDLAANAGGALLGALAFADPFYSMATRPLGALRERLVIAGAWGDAALVLVMLWLLAQLNPALPFFGAGDLAAGAEGHLEPLKWIAAGMGICGFGLFVSTILRADHGSLRITLLLLTAALWLKFLFASIMLQPHFSPESVGGGRVLGLAAGLLLFALVRRLPRLGRVYLAFLMILAAGLFSKVSGAYSPVEELLRLFRWPHGQLGTFATLTRFLHELWPFAAVVFLSALWVRERRAIAAAVTSGASS